MSGAGARVRYTCGVGKRADGRTNEWWSLIDGGDTMVAVFRGPEHVYVHANAAYRRAVGGRDVMGLPARTALPELAEQDYIAFLDRLYATGEPAMLSEAPLRIDRDGDGRTEVAYFNLACHPTRGAAGEVDGILVQGFDVTEHVARRQHADEATARARAAAEAELARTRALVAAVHAIGRGGDDLDATLDALVEQGRVLLGAADVAINLVDARTGQLIRRRPSILVDPASRLAVAGLPVVIDVFAVEAMVSRRPVVIADLQTDPRVDPAIKAALPTVVATVIGPLIAGGSVIGLMGVRWTREGDFGARQVELAEALAAHAANAIRTAGLVERVRADADRADRARVLLAALSHTRTLREMAEAVLDEGLTALEGRAGAIVLVSGDPPQHELVLSSETTDAVGRPAHWPTVEEGSPIAEALRSREPVFHEPRPPAGASGQPRSEGAVEVALPLLLGERLVGAIGVGYAAPRAFDAGERSWLADLAQYCAMALERARLHDDARRSEERYRVAAEASRTLVWELDHQRGEIIRGGGGVGVFGYAEGEARPDPAWWRERVHPEDIPSVQATFEAANRSGTDHWTAEYRFRRADGSYARRLDVVHVERDASGAPLRSRGAAVDVTVWREAAAKRAEVEAVLARAAERERIAMDLHDGVLGTLGGAIAALGAAERLLPEHADRAASTIVFTRAQVRDAMGALREYVRGLRPPAAGPSELRAGLAALAQQVRAGSIAVDLVVAPAADEVEAILGPDWTGDLLQVAREAVANALGHGAPTRIVVRLEVGEDAVRLIVRDDGRGFDSAATRPDGHGIANMVERARRLGGSLDVESEPGRGTDVRMVVPLVGDAASVSGESSARGPASSPGGGSTEASRN